MIYHLKIAPLRAAAGLWLGSLLVLGLLQVPSAWAGDGSAATGAEEDLFADPAFEDMGEFKAVIGDGPSMTLELARSTQGPPWPPSEIMNEDGEFIVIGLVPTEVAPGVVVPIPGQALVSAKETVPPLDAEGREDFSEIFGAPFHVIRELDLSPGSPDLDMVLHTNSYGPAVGNFGGGPRIPAEGESPYNLNSRPPTCAELFPTASSGPRFHLPSVPLQKAPIWGFRGDGVAYDLETGESFDPQLGSGFDCPPQGCPGEDPVDARRRENITLGEWLEARGIVKITLINHDPEAGGFTHARFEFRFEGMIPHALYTTWVVRLASFALNLDPDPLGLPNIVVTDAQGNGQATTVLPNPFPSFASEQVLHRILGIGVGYHPDFQAWGACFGRLGPGVDINAIFNTFADGTQDLTPFVTVQPR